MKSLKTLILPIASLMLISNSYAANNVAIKVPDIVPNKIINQEEVATKSWQKSGIALPIKTNNGMIKYPFSESVPTITCSPLHVCDVELQAGEKILNVAMGDQVRWLTSPANSGVGDKTSPHVIIKPTDDNISTNMIITTDKRTYYLLLTSKKTDYVTRLSFYYPHDIVQNWQNANLMEKEQELQKIAGFPTITAQNLDFDYEVTASSNSSSNKLLKPIRVFNDTKHVYLQMSKELSSHEAPILMVVGSDNQTQLVNYRVKNDYYIVDRLFEKADLIIGVGRHQEKIRIVKNKPRTCFYNCN